MLHQNLVSFGMFVAVVVIGFAGGLAQAASYNALIKDSMMKDASAVPLSLFPFAISSSAVISVAFLLMAAFRSANLM